MPYDDKGKPQSTLPSDDELRQIIGIDKHRENAAEAAAQDVLAKERAAATGKDPSNGGVTAANTKTAAEPSKAEGKSRADLQSQENEGGGFFKPDKTPHKEGGILNGRKRKRYLAAVLISGLIGGGAGAGLLGTASGPLQFIQAGRLLQNLHMDGKSEQTEGRVWALARYARFAKAGVPQNSRLSFLGNKIADKAEARFNKMGFTSTYGNGAFGLLPGYIIDPAAARASGADPFNKMTGEDLTPDKFADFMEKEFGTRPTVTADGKVHLDIDKLDDKGYRRLSKTILKASGAGGVYGALGTRYAAFRAGFFRWNPIKKADTKIKKAIDRKIAFNKERRAAIKEGTGASRPGAIEKEQVQGEDGQPQDAGDTDAKEGAIDDLLEEAEKANAEGGEAKSNFTKLIESKITAGALSVVGVIEVICLLLYIQDHTEELTMRNVLQPLQRVSGEMMALGSMIENSSPNLDADKGEQMGWFMEKMVDRANNHSFFEAESINAGVGREGGVKAPESFNIKPKDNILYKLFGTKADPTAVRTAVEPVCKLIGTTLGVLLLTAAVVVISGPVAAAAGLAFAVLALPQLIEWISEKLAGNEVDPDDLIGANWGSAADYGTHHLANNVAMSDGGLPLTQEEAMYEKSLTDELLREEFQSKSLAYRLFSPEDPYSLMGQVIQQQAPDPAANVAKYAGSFLNIGQMFSSLFGKQLQFATVGAASLPYDYGAPVYGYTAKERNSDQFKKPYTNAVKAVELLDAAQAEAGGNIEENELVQRAKVCFGVIIEKKAAVDPDNPNAAAPELWGVAKPQQNLIPAYSTVESGKLPASEGDDKDYECQDDSDEWLTMRAFIGFSQDMNKLYCREATHTQALTKQACLDLGVPV